MLFVDLGMMFVLGILEKGGNGRDRTDGAEEDGGGRND